MNLWSFWVDAWMPLYFLVSILAVTYFVWLVAALVQPSNRANRVILLCCFLSAVLGWFVLGRSFPSA